MKFDYLKILKWRVMKNVFGRIKKNHIKLNGRGLLFGTGGWLNKYMSLGCAGSSDAQPCTIQSHLGRRQTCLNILIGGFSMMVE